MFSNNFSFLVKFAVVESVVLLVFYTMNIYFVAHSFFYTLALNWIWYLLLLLNKCVQQYVHMFSAKINKSCQCKRLIWFIYLSFLKLSSKRWISFIYMIFTLLFSTFVWLLLLWVCITIIKDFLFYLCIIICRLFDRMITWVIITESYFGVDFWHLIPVNVHTLELCEDVE